MSSKAQMEVSGGQSASLSLASVPLGAPWTAVHASGGSEGAKHALIYQTCGTRHTEATGEYICT